MEGLQKKESKKQEFKKRLDAILNREVTVENLSSYMNLALDELVALVGDVVGNFKEKGDLTGKELEDAAFKANDLPEIEGFLDNAQEKIEKLGSVDEYINSRIEKIGEVITPSDRNGVIVGSGEKKFESPGIKPRLKALLYILANNGVDLNSLTSLEGIITEDMMRNLSYVEVEIPVMSRLILVCDEEQNATYFFDLEKLKEREVSNEQVRGMTKIEKNELIKANPGIGYRLIYSPHWIKNVESLLLNDLPEVEGNGRSNHVAVEGKDGLPKVCDIELDPWKHFWVDPETGKHWGSCYSVAAKLGYSSGYIKKKIREFNIESRKILNIDNRVTKAYRLEDFAEQEEIKELRELPTAEKSGEWKGFYIDESGNHWGSALAIYKKLETISNHSVIDIATKFGVAHISIRNISGHKVEAYNYEQFITLDYVRRMLSAPKTGEEEDWKEFYTDDKGRHWGSIRQIIERINKFGLGRTAIEEYSASNFKSLEIRDKSDHLRKAFCYEDVMDDSHIKKILDIPVVDREGEWKSFYCDGSGKHWAPIGVLGNKVGKDDRTIKRAALNLPALDIIDASGRVTKGYCYEAIEKLVGDAE